MKSILICPSPRPEVPLLNAEAPLAASFALGQGLLEYWMSYLACADVKEVVLLAEDRPEQVRKLVGDGSRWGIAAEVKEEPHELTAEEASEKYDATAFVMDHFPGMPSHPLFTSYAHWFKALANWMPRAQTPDRVGVRELQPGVWAGLHGHISREARLVAPCWLGDHVYVGAGAVVGPCAMIEHGALIEPKAEIHNSVIGAATFVGQYVQITNSLAWGGSLVNWQSGLENKVSDSFLLSSLHPQHPRVKSTPFLAHIENWLAQWKEEPSLEPQSIFVKKGS